MGADAAGGRRGQAGAGRHRDRLGDQEEAAGALRRQARAVPADPRIAQLDLAYHDIRRGRGLFTLLEKRGLAARATTDPAIFRAKSIPPQTTRAKLRGEFIRAAQEGRNDYTVDWVHLKLNDQAQRTVLCKDPFVAVDERVERLIASMRRPGSGLARGPRFLPARAGTIGTRRVVGPDGAARRDSRARAVPI